MKWSGKPRSAECPFLYQKVALATVQVDGGPEEEIQVEEVSSDPPNSVEVIPRGCGAHSVPLRMGEQGYRRAFGLCGVCQSIIFGQEIS